MNAETVGNIRLDFNIIQKCSQANSRFEEQNGDFKSRTGDFESVRAK
jgi:hypothetical protein